jgi:hypothetical protein
MTDTTVNMKASPSAEGTAYSHSPPSSVHWLVTWSASIFLKPLNGVSLSYSATRNRNLSNYSFIHLRVIWLCMNCAYCNGRVRRLAVNYYAVNWKWGRLANFTSNVQQSSCLCWPVHGAGRQGDQCSVGWVDAYTSFEDESAGMPDSRPVTGSGSCVGICLWYVSVGRSYQLH